MEGVAGTVHEVGHAMYEQGRPGGEMEDLPVSRALSMGVHESQVGGRLGVPGPQKDYSSIAPR